MSTHNISFCGEIRVISIFLAKESDLSSALANKYTFRTQVCLQFTLPFRVGSFSEGTNRPDIPYLA